MKAGLFFGQNAVDQNAADYNGWSGLLSGCVPDARDLALMFASLGFETRAVFSGWNVGVTGPVAANAWRLTLHCTRQAFRDGHAKLQAVAQAGDLVVIGNSGHGYQYDTPFHFNGGQGMCFADGTLRDSELHDLMRRWRAGVQVVYLLDTCYSGGMDRAFQRLPARVMPWSLKPRVKIERPELRSENIAAQVIQLCAAEDDETASDGPTNGAFTGSLLAVMDQARARGASLSWGELLAATAAVMGGAFSQHPVLRVLGQGEELAEARAI